MTVDRHKFFALVLGLGLGRVGTGCIIVEHPEDEHGVQTTGGEAVQVGAQTGGEPECTNWDATGECVAYADFGSPADECTSWDPSGECVGWGGDSGYIPADECTGWDPSGECVAWGGGAMYAPTQECVQWDPSGECIGWNPVYE
ncbi:MAG: hypothetical protein KF901_14005 [Myxococcales bacterium]|nr:hypothetical protein [Myxococcales bacterium]